MSEHLRELLHHAHALHELAEHLTTAAIERDFTAMALDVSKITAATTEIERIATAAQSGDAADVAAAVAKAQADDQAALDAASAPLTSAVAQLTTLFPATSTPPTGLTVSPATVNFSVTSGSATFDGPSSCVTDASASSPTATRIRCCWLARRTLPAAG